MASTTATRHVMLLSIVPRGCTLTVVNGHSASVRRLSAPKAAVVCCGEGVLSVIAIFQQ
jgi:hypothetical protein